MSTASNRFRKRFIVALAGTGVVALCCFTSFLVLSLGVIGLSVMTPYLDYVLLPALVIMILVAARAYQKWQRSPKKVAPGTSCREIKARAEAKLIDIHQKHQDLEEMEVDLRQLAETCQGQGPLSECTILGALDEKEEDGRG